MSIDRLTHRPQVRRASSWLAWAVVTALAAGALVSLPTQPAQAATPQALPGAEPQQRPIPRTALPFHGLGSAAAVPMEPPVAKAAGAPSATLKAAVAGPARQMKVAGGGVAALDGPVAPDDVLFARPGFAIGDTSLIVYFTKDVAGDPSWTTWQAVVTDVETGQQQTSPVLNRDDSGCGQMLFCRTLTASGGWTLTPGKPYSVTVRVFLPNGTAAESAQSAPSQARAVIDPPELPADQAGGCACPNVLTRAPGVQALRGDLVNTGTGAYVRTERDAGVSSFGLPFQAVRLYGSTKAHAGMFGPGWSWTYDVLVQPLDGGRVRVWAEDGASTVFTPDGDGGYNRPLRVQSRLVKDGAGWRLTTADQRVLSFNAGGRLTTVANKRGLGVRLAYDAAGHLSTATDAAGRVVRFETSPDGFITLMTLADGRSVAYGYTAGLLSSVRDARGLTWRYGYDPGNRLSQVTDPSGDVIARVTYGADTRVTSQADGVGSTIRFSFNADTQTATAVDDDGVRTLDTYRKGVLVNTRNGNGDSVNVRYDAGLNANLSVDAAGNQTDVEHDGDGNVTQVRAPDPFGYVERNSYTNNNLTKHTDARGNDWDYDYNANNDMTGQADPEQKSGGYRYTYDDRGLVETRRDARGKTTRYTYDADGNRTAETSPTGRRTEFGYDGSGRLLTVTDPRGTGDVSAATRQRYTTRIGYDAEDRIVTRQQPNKKLPYVWEYDEAGQPSRSVDPLLRSTRWQRDAAGRVTAIIDPKGRATRYTYTPAGRTASVTDASGARTSWTYEPRGRIQTEVSARGNALADAGAPASTVAQYTTTFTYDPAGNLVQSTRPYPDDPSKTVKVDSRFDQLNRPTTQLDELGGTTRMRYDEAGNLVGMQDENERTLGYKYDKANRRIEGVDSEERTAAKVEYDESGNTVRQTSPTGGVTTWDYDDDGRAVAITEPRGNVTGATAADYTTRYAYDPAGNLAKVTDPLGHVSEQTYDATDRVIEAVDPNGNTTRAVYDDADQPVAVFGPTARGSAQDWLAGFKSATARVTSQGPVSGTIIAPGSVVSPTSFAVTTLAGLVGVPVTRYAFDASGQTVATADQLGHIRSTGYDSVDRPTSQTDPLGRTRRMSYDAEGNLTAMRSASNTPEILLNSDQKESLTSRFMYNPVGWLTKREQGTGPTYSYGYDSKGRVTSMADPAGVTGVTYNDTGLVTKVARGAREFTYAYDSDDNITSRTYPDGTQIKAEYDVGDRMKNVTTTRGGSAQRFDFQYDVADRLVSTRYPNSTGAEEKLNYDRAGRLTGVDSTSNAGVRAAYDLTLDPVGNPTQISSTRSSGGGAPAVTETTAYDFDASNRLTDACYGATGCGSRDRFAEKYSYDYDLAGNRTKQVYTKTGAGLLGLPAITATSYLYDPADQLKSAIALGANPKITTYDYDGEGNQTRSGSDRFSYNLDHTLSSAQVSGQTSTFAYDGSGNRIAATVGNGTSQETRSWEWDTLNAVPMLAVESRNTGGASAGAAGGKDAGTARAYTYGAGGQTLALHFGTQGASAGSVYTHDWLGGTADLLAADGTAQWSYSYDPFGNPRGTGLVTGGRKLAAGAPANPLQYTGAYNDEAAVADDSTSAAAGNYHLRARDYDPGTGRFTGTDPMTRGVGSAGISSYVYADNRATTATDPSGMQTDDSDPVNPMSAEILPPTEDRQGNPLDTDVQAAIHALDVQKEAAQNALNEAENFTKQLGDELIHLVMDLIGITDATNCIRNGDIGACISTALNAVPWGKLFKAAKVAIKAVGIGRKLIEGYSRLKAARVAVEAIVQRAAQAAAEGAKATKKAVEKAARDAAKKTAQVRARNQATRQAAADARQDAAKVARQKTKAEQNDLEKVGETRRPGETETCPIGNSFTGDTRVLMADGSTKVIKDVKPGDTVRAGSKSVADDDQAVAESKATHRRTTKPDDAGAGSGESKPAARQVTAAITGHGVKQLVDLRLVGVGSPPTTKPAVLTATGGHALWTTEHGWIRAATIGPGNHLLDPIGHKIQVSSVEHRSTVTTVYNLSIDDRHTYYVLPNGTAATSAVLVHNAGPCNDLGDDWVPQGADQIQGSTNCMACADEIVGRLGGGEKIWVTPTRSNYLPKYREQDSEWIAHQVVVKDGRVYDGFGPRNGVPVAQWKRLWDGADEGLINFGRL